MHTSHVPTPIFHKLSESEVIRALKKSPVLYWRFNALNDIWKQRFLDYCAGKKTLPLTYDPFFKKLFHPDIHPQRLSRFLSSILGRTVKVIRSLPIEDTMLEGGVLLIMDILVELDDGSLANIEVQKVPYSFPGQRMSCYSADLLLRQYSRVKGELGKDFKYDNIKKVYTIILFEKSIPAFHQTGQAYVHMGKTAFDTGLDLELLQEYCLIALDVYRENLYAENSNQQRNERSAWIGLLATENVKDAEHLIAQYPWLAEIYAEMASYMHNPEEVLTMFSESLKILDQNTVQFMIEEQAAKLAAQLELLDAQADQILAQANEIEAQANEIEAQANEIEAQANEIEAQANEIEAQANEIEEQANEIEAQANELTQLYKTTINTYQEFGLDKQTAIEKLAAKLQLSPELAAEKVDAYWDI